MTVFMLITAWIVLGGLALVFNYALHNNDYN